MARWSRDVPLLALTSGGESPEFDQWTILAPRTTSHRIDVRTSDAQRLHEALREFSPACDPAITPATSPGGAQRLPFASGWIGFIGYDCGALFEPHAMTRDGAHTRVPSTSRGKKEWPDAMLCRVERALIYCHAHGVWFEVGRADGREVASLVDEHASDCDEECGWSPCDEGALRAGATDGQFAATVRRTIELIRAGDIFQTNVSQEYRAAFTGSARAFALDALACAAPRYGAALELDDDHAVVSLSPELFLAVDGATRTVTTRPIKGTRALHRDAEALRASEKDAAELHMIVDLMRNDLGRVCELGSVRVTRAREIEPHPTILHAVAEVSGRLATSADLGDLFAATFPPGSVTGAPKVRAMQIIDGLEASRRGPYCGAIGFSSGCGSALFNVAIRTAVLTRSAHPHEWAIDYRAGCGIVAESDPTLEEAESNDKTLALRTVLARNGVLAHPHARP